MILLLFAACALYFAAAPAVVNGDGLGYLRAAMEGGRYPGHLGYLPLLRLLPGTRAVELLPWARALSVLSGVGALAAFFGAARRLELRAPLAATAALASSFALVASASDVECYAPALAMLCLALYAITRRWELVAALATAAAALIHVENLLFVIPLGFATRRRVAVWAMAPVALAYAAARSTPLGAGHGFHYPLHLWTPLVAVYGAAKALVYSPYRYEASWAQVIGWFAVGAGALAFALALAQKGGAPLGRAVTLGWALPYSAVGMVFFASDHERWIFLLPLLFLSVAAADRGRATWMLAAALLVANAIAWGPRARNDAWRQKAEAASAHLQPGDLVISPGHGWDEYVGFWSGPPVRQFPLVYFAGALGGRAPLEARLAEEIARAPRAVLVRMDDDQPLGWKELRLFGIDRSIISGVSGDSIPLGDGVYRLMGATRSRN